MLRDEGKKEPRGQAGTQPPGRVRRRHGFFCILNVYCTHVFLIWFELGNTRKPTAWSFARAIDVGMVFCPNGKNVFRHGLVLTVIN